MLAYGLLFGHPCQFYNRNINGRKWQIKDTGDIILHGFHNLSTHYNYNNACFLLEDLKIVPRFCISPLARPKIAKYPFRTLLMGILTFISTCLLCVTFFVYAVLPSLRNIHGKIIMCHIFSLALFFFTLTNTTINPKVTRKADFSYLLRKVLGE